MAGEAVSENLEAVATSCSKIFNDGKSSSDNEGVGATNSSPNTDNPDQQQSSSSSSSGKETGTSPVTGHHANVQDILTAQGDVGLITAMTTAITDVKDEIEHNINNINNSAKQPSTRGKELWKVVKSKVERRDNPFDVASRADFDEAVDMSLMLSMEKDRTSRRRNALSERSAVERMMVHKTVDYLFKFRDDNDPLQGFL